MDFRACGQDTPVPSYRLVQPSYILLKISSIFSVLKYDINVGTGEWRYKTSTRAAILHFANCAMTVAKAAQLVYPSILLFRSIEIDAQAVTPLVAVLGSQCLLLVSLIWNLEVHRHEDELLVLLRWLKLPHQQHTTNVKVLQSVARTRQNCGLPFVRNVCRLVQSRFEAYVRATLADFSKLRESFSVRDVLVLAAPFAVGAIGLAAISCVLIDKPMEAMLLYAFPNPAGAFTSIACKVFDISVVSFVTLSLHAVFFVSSLFQCVFNRRLSHLFRQAW